MVEVYGDEIFLRRWSRDDNGCRKQDSQIRTQAVKDSVYIIKKPVLSAPGAESSEFGDHRVGPLSISTFYLVSSSRKAVSNYVAVLAPPNVARKLMTLAPPLLSQLCGKAIIAPFLLDVSSTVVSAPCPSAGDRLLTHLRARTCSFIPTPSALAPLPRFAPDSQQEGGEQAPPAISRSLSEPQLRPKLFDGVSRQKVLKPDSPVLLSFYFFSPGLRSACAPARLPVTTSPRPHHPVLKPILPRPKRSVTPLPAAPGAHTPSADHLPTQTQKEGSGVENGGTQTSPLSSPSSLRSGSDLCSPSRPEDSAEKEKIAELLQRRDTAVIYPEHVTDENQNRARKRGKKRTRNGARPDPCTTEKGKSVRLLLSLSGVVPFFSTPTFCKHIDFAALKCDEILVHAMSGSMEHYQRKKKRRLTVDSMDFLPSS
ncbi:unnamed protein product [Cyprideis torosa]|uniref:Uncharacterized protein n=1 Tax=Cyprideis torosa TaxID=163714 RepID=A0A7R8ZIU9_9CRUS|nr:unnamed protein product [Cyprideis torosa]CAG0880804.1 unnamed protein product [Cyprideis torosa]